jgi:hypothetical protein
MFNPLADVNWHPDRIERRSFGRSLLIGFPVLAAFFFLVGRILGHGLSGHAATILGASGAAAGLVFWILPGIVRPFYVAWYGVSSVIGLVVGNVVLATVYYVAFTSIGLVLRLFRRRPLRVGFDRAADTYWTPAEPPPDVRRYYRQF